MNNEGKDATLSREQVERYYAEVTSPDELGITDPRMKAVFDMALRWLEVGDGKKVTDDWCHWYQDGDETSDTWATSCGQYFRLDEGTPTENKMCFCYHCGKALEQNLFEDDELIAKPEA